MFTFLHAADIHLDSPLRNLEQYEGAPVQALRQASRRAFENLVELAVSKSVDLVLISGDLYDGDWKDYNTGLYFISQISRLNQADIKVCIISGNHDAASKMTKSLPMPENACFLSSNQPETICFDNIQAAVHGQSFATPAVKKNLALLYPDPVPGYFNIGMLHTCATGREGHDSYAPCKIEDMALKGYDYWALGHVHQQEILTKDPFIVFPGNIQGRHVRETGPKGCMIVEVDDNGCVKPDFHTLDVLRWQNHKIDISDLDDVYQVVDRVCEKLTSDLETNDGLPLAARVELTGNSDAHKLLSSKPEHWINQIRSNALDAGAGQIWIEKIKIKTSQPVKHESDKNSDTPLGEILELFEIVPSDPDLLKFLKKSLDDLYRKLPKELKESTHDQDDILPLDDKQIISMLETVKPLLVNRLLSKGLDD